MGLGLAIEKTPEAPTSSGESSVLLSASTQLPCFVVHHGDREIRLTTQPLSTLPSGLFEAGNTMKFGSGDQPSAIALGPEGGVYFAADQGGYDVTAPDGRRWRSRHAGAIFRCRRDGSELEQLARGLRAPKWLAFDETGNLWAAEAGFFPVPEGFDGHWHAALDQDAQVRATWESERQAAPTWEAAQPFLQALTDPSAEPTTTVDTAPLWTETTPEAPFSSEALWKRWSIVLDTNHPTTARRTAFWELAERAGNDPQRLSLARPTLEDPDPTWRTLVLTTLGDTRCSSAVPAVEQALADPEPAVAAAAALALGKLVGAQASAPLLTRLRQPDVPDALVHASAVTLARVLEPVALAPLLKEETPQVRIIALEALRRLQSPECRHVFHLATEEPEETMTSLRESAIRAIYDTGIEGAWPALALVLDQPGPLPLRLVQRALEASLDLGREEDALRVARFITTRLLTPATQEANAEVLLAAARILDQWDEPLAKESVGGRTRFAQPRAPATAWPAWAQVLPTVDRYPGPARETLVPFTSRWRQEIGAAPSSLDAFAQFLLNASLAENRRLYHFAQALADTARPPGEHLRLAETALTAASSPRLRMAARTHFFAVAKRDIPWLLSTLHGAELPEKQHALTLISARQGPEVDAYLLQLLQQARTEGVDPVVLPELLEAVRRRTRSEGPETRAFREALEDFRASRHGPSLDALRPWRPALEAGDSLAGRALFFSTRTRCAQCHAVDGRGGGATMSGPDLDGVAARLEGPALLESLVRPNARLAPGYGFATAVTRDGASYSGRLEETSSSIRVYQPGLRLTFSRGELASLTSPASPCRPMAPLLELKELRDLVTFLRTLKSTTEEN